MFVRDPSTAVVVAVDVGKDALAVSVTDGRRRVLLAPFDAALARALPQVHHVEQACAGHIPHVARPEVSVNQAAACMSAPNGPTTAGAWR